MIFETFGVGDTNEEGIILVADDILTFGVGDTNEEGIILVADDILNIWCRGYQ